MKCLLWCKTVVGLTQAPVELQEKEIFKKSLMLINILVIKVLRKASYNCSHSLTKVWKNFISYLNLLTWDVALWFWLLFIFYGQVPQGMVGK